MASGLTEAADLIVEDGTGIDDANSYASRATVEAYANLRQDVFAVAWTGADEPNQVAALVIASQYLDLRWRYEGVITNPGTDVLVTQKLQWPRTGVVDCRGVAVEDDEIPLTLEEACSEYAARAIDPVTGDARALLVDLESQDASGRNVIETLAEVGPLKEQIKYSKTKGTRTWANYGNADRIIRESGYLASAGETLVVI